MKTWRIIHYVAQKEDWNSLIFTIQDWPCDSKNKSVNKKDKSKNKKLLWKKISNQFFTLNKYNFTNVTKNSYIYKIFEALVWSLILINLHFRLPTQLLIRLSLKFSKINSRILVHGYFLTSVSCLIRACCI